VPFSQIKAVKNQSRDFGYALFNVRVTFDSDVDEAMRLMGEIGTALYSDPALRADILKPIELFGLDHFEGVAIVIMGGIRTRPLAQYGISRAFNKLLKEKVDASGGRVRFAGSVPVWLSALPPPEPPKTA
jgi:small conductance mechanosensitive channel